MAAGFSLHHYLRNVKATFEEAFYVNDEKDDKRVIKTVIFAPTSRFESNAGTFSSESQGALHNIDPPACVLDLYEARTNATVSQEIYSDSAFTNTGDLEIYIFMRALILVSNRRPNVAHFKVRQLALDIAGLVTEVGQFGTPSGLAQVSNVQAVQEVQEMNNHLIGWEVLWHHQLQLNAPDYSNPALRGLPEADANPIYDVSIFEEIGVNALSIDTK